MIVIDDNDRIDTTSQSGFQIREMIPGATIANEASPAYLPPAELYDTGIYQETIAVLAPGCLETLIEAISEKIAEIFELV